MAGPRVLCLGCGDAFSARWYSSCLALEGEDRWLLIDCPHPIRKILREASAAAGMQLDLGRFDGVVLTHLHADHASGVEGLAFYSAYIEHRRATLLAHPAVLGRLWDDHLRANLHALGGRYPGDPDAEPVGLDHYLNLIPLSDESVTQFGPFQIECRQTIHPIPTFALRIQVAGRRLGYSADTSFDPELIAWLEPADLVIHETNHGVHTPYEALAGLPAALRRRMRLIHYPDDFDLEHSAIEPLIPGFFYRI